MNVVRTLMTKSIERPIIIYLTTGFNEVITLITKMIRINGIIKEINLMVKGFVKNSGGINPII